MTNNTTADAGINLGVNLGLDIGLESIISSTVGSLKRYAEPSLNTINPHGYIFQFHGTPGTNKCHQSASQFRKAANTLNLDWKERQAFHRLFNGMSINVDCYETLQKLGSLPMVKAIWPNEVRKKLQFADQPNIEAPPLSTTTNRKGNLETAHRYTGVERLRQKYGLTGKGVKIGIIDTGVDYNHPYLGACWKTPNCPFQYGYDFVGDQYDFNKGIPPSPGPLPLDTCDGHGTHIAGIVAANGSLFTGVAPGATLGVYRVISCATGGQTTDDILLKAMEMAQRDGMDIINMSFGGPTAWTENALAVAASELVKRGIIVTSSLGNSGVDGLFTSLSPAVGEGVMGVGAFEIETISFLALNVVSEIGSDTMAVTMSPTSLPFSYNKDVPIVWATSDQDSSGEGCAPLDKDKVAGNIVFALRGNCTFVEKANFAQDAGAVGLLIGNTQESSVTPTGDRSVNIRMGIISLNDTAIMKEYLKSNHTYLSTEQRVITYPDTSVGKMSFFSPYGPDPELRTTPAFAAPGSQILSTYPLALGGFRTLFGTSMSAPYAAAIMALTLEANKKWGLDIEELKSMVQQQSTLVLNPDTNRPVSVLWQGSGKSNVTNLMESNVLACPGSLHLNYTMPREKVKLNIALKNIFGNKNVVYQLDHIAADSISAFLPNGSYTSDTYVDQKRSTSASINFRPGDHVGIIKPKTEKNISLTITPPATLTPDGRWFYSGYIVVNTYSIPSNRRNKNTIHIPYSGYLGDYRQYPIMDPLDKTFPILAYNDADKVVEGNSYAIDNTNTIDVALRLITPTRLLKIQLMHKNNNTFAGYLSRGYSKYLGRNMRVDGVPLYRTAVNGTVFNDPENPLLHILQPGAYYVQIDALRPGSDPITSTNYQTWKSPSFVISSVNLTNSTETISQTKDIPAFNE
ncbi:hypothetical protein H4219_005483 [Mycoemilia scoparia]|uniref:Peptidase S8/S53 domain-containing protein n=1 Tax=Mycoemilia scoparia TaxID=417184 RepID=A0A9W8DP81_9FUNG|nr:hypothetical protein H4219_005483 [Mycoemilia scoparia]